jgi:hypothetical protein
MTYPPPNPPQPPGYGYGYTQPEPAFPVQFEIHRADTQSRALALFSIPFFFVRTIALIPAVFVLYFVMIAFAVVAWIGQWAILFTGRYPAGMHEFGTGVLRWQARVSAFMYGLTDRYPPFRLQP